MPEVIAAETTAPQGFEPNRWRGVLAALILGNQFLQVSHIPTDFLVAVLTTEHGLNRNWPRVTQLFQSADQARPSNLPISTSYLPAKISRVGRIKSVLGVDADYVLPDNVKLVYRTSLSVKNQVGRVQNHLHVIHSGVKDCPQQSDRRLLPGFVDKDLAIRFAV